ncbi:MAG TPA: DUF58 domain-containing protein [Oculatellaceae cyanobacterium]
MNEFLSALLTLFQDSTIPLLCIAAGIALLTWQRRAKPSITGLVWLLVPIPFWILSLWWGWFSWLALAYTPIYMALLLIDGLMLTAPPQQISLRRTVSPKLFIGKKSLVEIQVLNNSHNPISIELFDHVPPVLLCEQWQSVFPNRLDIQPFGQALYSYELFPTQRGQYPFEKIHARYRSRLGLLWLTLQGGRPETITVTPDLARIQRMRVNASKATAPGELQKQTLGSEGTRFRGLRHYFPGDDVRNMAWQATARLDQPVVRTFELEVEQPILVLLDAGRKMRSTIGGLSRYDQALNAALALCAVAIDRKDAVGATVFGSRILSSVPFGTGSSHWIKLLDSLSKTTAQQVEPDYARILPLIARGLRRRTLVILLTELIDPSTSTQLIQAFKSVSTQHTLLIATLSDPDLLRQAQSHPANAFDAYQKGVTLDLLALRQQALSALKRLHHATIIDAPPDKLDETLIRKYLETRRRLSI